MTTSSWLFSKCFSVFELDGNCDRLPKSFTTMDFDSELRIVGQPSAELKRILIAEPDQIVQKAITRLFETEGYVVDARDDGKAALDTFHLVGPAAVILDLELPFVSGTDVCREIRRESSVPIVIISAVARVVQKVRMFELGADDYVTKPFSPRELLARVRSLIRHTSTQVDDIAAFDSVRVDFAKMEATKDGRPVHLTVSEFKLLKLFLQREECILSSDYILNHVLGYREFPQRRTVCNHILNLRRKLERDPTNPIHFQTIHRIGYRFVR